MQRFVYILNAGSIKRFLDKIQSIGKPTKLTLKVLESMGFKSTNDRPLISIAKTLGFTSHDGTPTDRWQQFRDKANARRVLADGIREHYAELFKMYPDAYRQDNEALTNFFSTQTSLAARAVSSMVQTFKALVENAGLESPDTLITTNRSEGAAAGLTGDEQTKRQLGDKGIVININIQLTLPDTTNVDTYEAIFTAMKKHILS